MAGSFSPRGKQRLMTHFASLNLYLGLAADVPQVGQPLELSTITEITTPGYARVPITWVAPGAVEPVQLANTTETQIGPVTQDMAAPALYAFLTPEATATTGEVLYVWPLAESIQSKAQKPILLPAGALIIE